MPIQSSHKLMLDEFSVKFKLIVKRFISVPFSGSQRIQFVGIFSQDIGSIESF